MCIHELSFTHGTSTYCQSGILFYIYYTGTHINELILTSSLIKGWHKVSWSSTDTVIIIILTLCSHLKPSRSAANKLYKRKFCNLSLQMKTCQAATDRRQPVEGAYSRIDSSRTDWEYKNRRRSSNFFPRKSTARGKSSFPKRTGRRLDTLAVYDTWRCMKYNNT